MQKQLYVSPLYNKPKRKYNKLAIRGENRCVWRLVLRMQGAGCSSTLFLLCIFYFPCKLNDSTLFADMQYFFAIIGGA